MIYWFMHLEQEHRGLLTIRYPMEHGIVTDWNDMERIWQYIYSKDQLQTFSEEVSKTDSKTLVIISCSFQQCLCEYTSYR